MPDQPSWLQRVPDILNKLSASDAPTVFDRAAVEVLFGLRRRQAIRLLSQCGGYQAGRTFLVPREALLEYLNTRIDSERVSFAVRRKTRILDDLNKSRRLSSGQVIIGTRHPERGAFLPHGVHLRPGLLEVRFDSPVQLLEKLFALAQAVSNDFDQFERASQQYSDT